MTESEAWTYLVENYERAVGGRGICVLVSELHDVPELIRKDMRRRLLLFSPANHKTCAVYWWDYGEIKHRATACGLLAAMAQEDGR